MLATTLPSPATPTPDDDLAGAHPQLVANARQLHRYLTGDSTCACGETVKVGARRCSACGACSECGSVYCRAGYVPCEEAIEARFQRYVARVAPLLLVARVTGVAS